MADARKKPPVIPKCCNLFVRSVLRPKKSVCFVMVGDSWRRRLGSVQLLPGRQDVGGDFMKRGSHQ